MKKYVVMKVRGPDFADVECAVVELDAQSAGRLLGLVDRVKEMGYEILRLVLADQVDWYVWTDEMDEYLGEDYGIDDDGILVLDKFEVKKPVDAQVECQEMNVYGDGIWWSAILEHTDSRIETQGALTREQLSEIVGRIERNEKEPVQANDGPPYDAATATGMYDREDG